MSFNEHVQLPKPEQYPPCPQYPQYPQYPGTSAYPAPYFGGKVNVSHVTTPAAREQQFQPPPTLRGPNDPRPLPPHVGTPHQSGSLYEEQNESPRHSLATEKSQIASELPTSFRGSTVQRSSTQPVRSPAANTFKGIPINRSAPFMYPAGPMNSTQSPRSTPPTNSSPTKAQSYTSQ